LKKRRIKRDALEKTPFCQDSKKPQSRKELHLHLFKFFDKPKFLEKEERI